MTDNILNYFKAILCLNGNLPNKHFFDKYSNLSLVASDGAGNKLINIGINPDFVVGDLDSFNSSAYELPSAKLVEYRDQNYNDFEKTILFLKNNDLFPAIVCGIFGGEADHIINNINCFMKYAQSNSMVFYDEEIIEQPKWGFALSDSALFSGRAGNVISILPQPHARVTTKGLKWDLCNKKLSIEGISSFRNLELSHNVQIKLHSGKILLIASRYLEL